MVTHDPARGQGRRPRGVPGRRPHRLRPVLPRRGRDPRDPEGARMTRVALKGISSRRMRTALTMFAIVLGVAMVAGAYTLTDTMRGASDSLSDAAYDGTAGVVSAKTAFDLKNDDQLGARPTIPASTLDEVRGSARRGERRGQHLRRGPDRGQGRRRGRQRSVLRVRRRPGRRRAHPVPAEGRPVRHRLRRGRDRRRHRREGGLRPRRRDHRPGPRARAHSCA